MKTITFAIFLTLTGIAAADDRETFVLAYSQADFESKASVQALYRKIRSVAREHCPNYFTERSLPESARCVSRTVDDLVQAVRNPALSGLACSEEGLRIASEEIASGQVDSA